MKSGTMYNQKDIVVIPFPYTDLTGNKLRPALILSKNQKNDFICCLVTGNSAENGREIRTSFLQQGSLPIKSWVKPHRLFTIDSRIIRKRIAKVNEAFHARIVKDIVALIK